jgi:hypothetical protein
MFYEVEKCRSDNQWIRNVLNEIKNDKPLLTRFSGKTRQCFVDTKVKNEFNFPNKSLRQIIN